MQDELTLLNAVHQNDEAARREMEQSLAQLKQLMDEAKHAHDRASASLKRAKDDVEEGYEGALRIPFVLLLLLCEKVVQ